jgi:hypothetical protein
MHTYQKPVDTSTMAEINSNIHGMPITRNSLRYRRHLWEKENI